MSGINRSQARWLWVAVTLVLMATSYWLGKQRHRLNAILSGGDEAVETHASLASSEFDYVQWTLEQGDTLPVFERMSSDEFSRWQAQQRRSFEQQFLFPYQSGHEVKAVGEPSSHRGYTQQEFWVTLHKKRLFRFYKLRPKQLVRTLPAIVAFMGHGSIKQLTTLSKSYQRATAAELANEGYLVFAMENVGMGPEDGKQTHTQLDSVLSLSGYSWYSLLFAHQRLLLDHVFDDPEVDSEAVGVVGVSTGGLLALSAAALEPRVKAASVHGIFASLAISFARDRELHCACGTIDGALPSFDLPRLALLVAPRPLHINNNRSDTFPPADAREALVPINPVFVQFGGTAPLFTSPEGKHSLALPEALNFLEESLR